MTNFEIIQIITGFVGSCGFAILFNVRGKKMIAAVLGGLLSWLAFVLLKYVNESEALRYFFVAFGISLYSEVLARKLKTPAGTFLMTALIPLIPGGSLYYTMAAVFEGNVEHFATKAVGTLSLSAALALGIVLASALAKIVQNAMHRRCLGREKSNT